MVDGLRMLLRWIDPRLDDLKDEQVELADALGSPYYGGRDRPRRREPSMSVAFRGLWSQSLSTLSIPRINSQCRLSMRQLREHIALDAQGVKDEDAEDYHDCEHHQCQSWKSGN